MITRRYPQPRGLDSEQAEYGFFVRLSGQDRQLLKDAKALATKRLGGQPSNPMLLLEMIKVYIDSAPGQTPRPSKYVDLDFD